MGAKRGGRAGIPRCALLLAGAIAAGLSSGCGRAHLGPMLRVSIAGAQIPVELVTSWLSDAKGTTFDVTPVAPVYLSQNGFAALRKGECDVACTDRPISVAEYADFRDAKPIGYRIAFFGFALYVNRANPVDSIFAGHITLVMQKRISDWKQLGGREQPISIYGPTKGTRGGQLLARQARLWFAEPTWTALETTVEIIDRVAADPGGIGFAPIGFDGGETRYLGLRMERHGSPALPSLEAIEADEYGYAKVIYVYALDPLPTKAAAILDHLYSDRGERGIRRTDLWPIPRDRAIVEPPKP